MASSRNRNVRIPISLRDQLRDKTTRRRQAITAEVDELMTRVNQLQTELGEVTYTGVAQAGLKRFVQDPWVADEVVTWARERAGKPSVPTDQINYRVDDDLYNEVQARCEWVTARHPGVVITATTVTLYAWERYVNGDN